MFKMDTTQRRKARFFLYLVEMHLQFTQCFCKGQEVYLPFLERKGWIPLKIHTYLNMPLPAECYEDLCIQSSCTTWFITDFEYDSLMV